jgi:hypothetical protein
VRVKKIFWGRVRVKQAKEKEGKIVWGKVEQVEAGNGYAIGMQLEKKQERAKALNIEGEIGHEE